MAALLLTGLGACRADSIVTPAAPAGPDCASAPCGAPVIPGMEAVPAPNASIVIDPLEDAVTRILPSLADARARAELAPVLGALRAELLAGRLAAARLQLARSYDAVDLADRRMSRPGATESLLDLANLSAIRLALVPAAAALGVAAP